MTIVLNACLNPETAALLGDLPVLFQLQAHTIWDGIAEGDRRTTHPTDAALDYAADWVEGNLTPGGYVLIDMEPALYSTAYLSAASHPIIRETVLRLRMRLPGYKLLVYVAAPMDAGATGTLDPTLASMWALHADLVAQLSDVVDGVCAETYEKANSYEPEDLRFIERVRWSLRGARMFGKPSISLIMPDRPHDEALVGLDRLKLTRDLAKSYSDGYATWCNGTRTFASDERDWVGVIGVPARESDGLTGVWQDGIQVYSTSDYNDTLDQPVWPTQLAFSAGPSTTVPTAGEVLVATEGASNYPATHTLTHYLDGVAVGTGTRYTLTDADAGKSYKVRDTITSPGMVTAIAESATVTVAAPSAVTGVPRDYMGTRQRAPLRFIGER